MDREDESNKSNDGSQLTTSQKAKELVFFFQLIIILIVVLACILNLTFNDTGKNLWTVLLSSSIGYILPNPRLTTSRTPQSQRNSSIINGRN